MASMTWSWEDYWGWVMGLEEIERQGWAIKQVVDIGWLGSRSVDIQVEILENAPFEVLKTLKTHYSECLKTETVLILNDHLKSRYKPKRRTKRK